MKSKFIRSGSLGKKPVIRNLPFGLISGLLNSFGSINRIGERSNCWFRKSAKTSASLAALLASWNPGADSSRKTV